MMKREDFKPGVQFTYDGRDGVLTVEEVISVKHWGDYVFAEEVDTPFFLSPVITKYKEYHLVEDEQLELDFDDLVWVNGCPTVSDPVNSPNHYKGTYGIECIEAIKNALTPDQFEGYCKGNVMKYLWRSDKKNRLEDIQKSEVYLNFIIEARNGRD